MTAKPVPVTVEGSNAVIGQATRLPNGNFSIRVDDIYELASALTLDTPISIREGESS